jgi:hypothetical protein
MQPKSLNSFLEDGISSLLPQTQRLLEIRQVFAKLLPGNLRRSSVIANFKQGKIVLFAANSAVAAKLKLLAPTLQDDLVKSGYQVTAMEVQVQPAEPAAKPSEKRANLTREAGRHLAELSSQLPDSKLKSIVDSMAKRSESEH